MPLIDPHAHLFDDRFRKDLPAVLDRAAAAGVERVVCLGIDLESSRAAVEIANTYPLVVAAVGIQPNHTAEAKAGDWEAVVRLAETEPRVVALGETGLDRYWDRAPFHVQEDYFARHIELARGLRKPFVIHCRDAERDVVKALRAQEQNGPLAAVMHSFSGDAATARECLDMGLYVSFAGMVTYPTAQNLRAVAAEVPIHFAVRTAGRDESRRADEVLTAADARRGSTFRVSRKTLIGARWRAASTPVAVEGCAWTLAVAVNEATAEVKYFVTNVTDQPRSRVLAVAFRRATIEHQCRLTKDEAGMTHFEGRHGAGLRRHLVVREFVSFHTDRLRGEKSAVDDGADVPGPEHPARERVPTEPRAVRTGARRTRHPTSPALKRTGHKITQETAA